MIRNEVLQTTNFRQLIHNDENPTVRNFSKAFDLFPHDRLLRKIAASGVDPRAVGWIRDFLLGRSQRFSVGGQLSEEVRVTSEYRKEVFLVCYCSLHR
jgi:hypothetical protein